MTAEMQSEIGTEIVATLEKEVDRMEQARTFRVPWESLETWQLVRRGRWHMQRRTREDTQMALRTGMSATVEVDTGVSRGLPDFFGTTTAKAAE